MQLYTAARSSAAFRVRIALNLKGFAYQSIHVNLRRGDQRAASYLAVNPQGLVPMLVDRTGAITQSLAILEYLEESRPAPAILPADAKARAWVRGFAQAICCDIHPLNNLRVLEYLTGALGLGEEDRLRWYRHWIALGLSALERRLRDDGASGRFCFGDRVTMADICLVPQIVNAQRFECPLDDYPRLTAVFETCMALTAFDEARPERQPDFA